MSDENFRYPTEPSCRKYLVTLPPGMGTGPDPIPYGKQPSNEKSPLQKAEPAPKNK